jgi:hypothetical protein
MIDRRLAGAQQRSIHRTVCECANFKAPIGALNQPEATEDDASKEASENRPPVDSKPASHAGEQGTEPEKPYCYREMQNGLVNQSLIIGP